jgi:hypothetical protein
MKRPSPQFLTPVTKGWTKAATRDHAARARTPCENRTGRSISNATRAAEFSRSSMIPAKPVRAITRRRMLGAGAALTLAGCVQQEGRALLSSDTHPDGYPTVEAVKEMGRLLRENSGGRLDIKIYAGGQLGAERDTLEITVFGGLDLNRVNLAPLNSIEPVTTIPSLPFLFRSVPHMRASLDGEPGQAILDSLEPHDLIGLCFYESGERSFYNRRGPIVRPNDMKGMKTNFCTRTGFWAAFTTGPPQ